MMYISIPLHNLTPNKFANMLRFGAMFNDETSFEVVLREAIDTLAGANPKHCCWVEISRAMDSSRDFIFSVYTYGGGLIRIFRVWFGV